MSRNPVRAARDAILLGVVDVMGEFLVRFSMP
jgi:hypothetical protein